MITVLLALSGALVYGISDFLGGLASRSVRPLVATSIAAAIGIVPMALSVIVAGGTFDTNAMFWGIVAGLCGLVGLVGLYTALAIGPMSVLSPVTSVLAALVPVGYGIATGSQLSAIGYCAVGAAIVAVALVAIVRDPAGKRLTPRGLIMALLAGCGFGGIVIALNATTSTEGAAPLLVARITLTVAVCVITAATARRRTTDGSRNSSRLTPRVWLIAGLCGVFDAGANIFLQAALHVEVTPSTLPIASVLNALYPIGTVLIAWALLRERLTSLQTAGLILGFAASAALALAG